jgi:heme oxygenase
MILTRLKQRTLWRRQQLEKKLDLFHSVKTLGDYQYLLGKLLGFYEPVETALEATFQWSVVNFEFQPRKKTPLLLQDLHSLGIADTLLLPRCKKKPMLDTLPRAMGCLYVFESATLGGGIVMRHLRRTLGISPEDGGAFFNSYGDQVMKMWNEFGRRLGAYAMNPDIEDAIIRAAIDTLMRMDQWMAELPAADARTLSADELDACTKLTLVQRKSYIRLA